MTTKELQAVAETRRFFPHVIYRMDRKADTLYMLTQMFDNSEAGSTIYRYDIQNIGRLDDDDIHIRVASKVREWTDLCYGIGMSQFNEVPIPDVEPLPQFDWELRHDKGRSK